MLIFSGLSQEGVGVGWGERVRRVCTLFIDASQMACPALCLSSPVRAGCSVQTGAVRAFGFGPGVRDVPPGIARGSPSAVFLAA